MYERRPGPRWRGRSLGVRAQTHFPVAIHDGSRVRHCRAVELSATGVVLERGFEHEPDTEDHLTRVELFVPDRDRPVRALARWVRDDDYLYYVARRPAETAAVAGQC